MLQFIVKMYRRLTIHDSIVTC